ncbi:unnamed protein product [Brachionus calyciflorus]|uniref:POU domain protein n=1 Tax=Brachionus calyciflorus TaxID=104777 RepID=A0A813NPI9_9BILA|nr:unnamed protein product [Brachionus calyciflorus]
MNPFYPTHHNHLTPFSPTNQAQHFNVNNGQFNQFSAPVQSQTSPNSSVFAAAQFYARSNQDQFNHRHRLQTQTPVASGSPNTPWKGNCFMDNFKFDPNQTIFSGIEDSFFARAEAAVAAAKQQDNIYMTSHHLPNRIAFDNSNESERASSTSSVYHHHHQSNNNFVDNNNNPFYNAFYQNPSNQITQHASAAIAAAAAAAAQIHHNEIDIDPRELETFAEKFKQRRIKLGVTQADVGQQLSKLKLPGVGSLSQSTICRFESLTLSHNNMIALKPVLQAWLEQAEIDAKTNRKKTDDNNNNNTNTTNNNLNSIHSIINPMNSLNTNLMCSLNHHNNQPSHQRDLSDRKRKRTSIAAPEKRSLEAYFSVQPRPSGEKIAQIADKLELKKNVVRVWFCNQRQKQKRMKFAAIQSR